MLAKKYRLSHQDFQKFGNDGFVRQNEYFKFLIYPNKFDFSRWAVVVGTDWSKSSVKRHKIKRQLMALIHNHKEILKLPYDFVIWPRLSLKDKDFNFIKEKFENAITLLKINSKDGANP